jgi:4-hydroxythreonine-4-phosphate dehydrogenase
MKAKPIIIVSGEPKSIFFEILFKSLKYNKFKSPIILISSYKILRSEMKRYKCNYDIKILNLDNLTKFQLSNKGLYLININFISNKSQIFIKRCFETAFKILKLGITKKFINGPINKSKFLDKKFPGITEYVSKNFKKQKTAMLIYNKKLSVCPVTTHLPLKTVTKKINFKLIKEKTLLINDFYIKNFDYRPKIAVTGLNPHCESILKFNEDRKILMPAIKSLQKLNIKISGPFPADTIFLKRNREKYDVIIGMYHDQVLSPFKTLFEYDAINITLGLPFLRISPDHGPNEKMFGKNKSNPSSLINCLKFLDKSD